MPLENKQSIQEFAIGKQILEIKKKIQLSEGQRKAHFEECDAEKRKNTEKIRQLKKDIKSMYDKLGKPVKCEEVLQISRRSRSAKSDLHSLRNKSPEQAISVVEYRLIDLHKKWDLLKYQRKKLENKLALLEETKERLTAELSWKQARESKTEKSPEKQRTCGLENRIHHTQLSAMEAETVRRKYRSIRSGLLADAAKYEAALKQAEIDIRSQEAEIKRLQDIKSEALGLRDATRGLLQRQEELAARNSKERERKLLEHRHEVEERRLQLEVLERRLFPASGVVPPLHRDSLTSLDNLAAVPPPEESPATTSAASQLEDAFKKLMVATGEVEPELVTQRFLGQKETRGRLTYLRGLTEEDKRKLEVAKSELNSQLESAKFAAEVKDKEQNLEEVETLKQQISNEEKRLLEAKTKSDAVRNSRLGVLASIRTMCAMLRDFGPPLPNDMEALQPRELLELLENKLKAIQDVANQKEEELRAREAARSRLDSRGYIITAPPPEEQHAAPTKQQGAESDEEEDIPTRGFLKRQAQIIVDAKSRRRFYRPSKHKGKTPLHLRK